MCVFAISKPKKQKKQFEYVCFHFRNKKTKKTIWIWLFFIFDTKKQKTIWILVFSKMKTKKHKNEDQETRILLRAWERSSQPSWQSSGEMDNHVE